MRLKEVFQEKEWEIMWEGYKVMIMVKKQSSGVRVLLRFHKVDMRRSIFMFKKKLDPLPHI